MYLSYYLLPQARSNSHATEILIDRAMGLARSILQHSSDLSKQATRHVQELQKRAVDIVSGSDERCSGKITPESPLRQALGGFSNAVRERHRRWKQAGAHGAARWGDLVLRLAANRSLAAALSAWRRCCAPALLTASAATVAQAGLSALARRLCCARLARFLVAWRHAARRGTAASRLGRARRRERLRRAVDGWAALRARRAAAERAARCVDLVHEVARRAAEGRECRELRAGFVAWRAEAWRRLAAQRQRGASG